VEQVEAVMLQDRPVLEEHALETQEPMERMELVLVAGQHTLCRQLAAVAVVL
jgi:hypothetical protein